MTDSSSVFDVIVVGAGVTGIGAGYYLGKAFYIARCGKPAVGAGLR